MGKKKERFFTDEEVELLNKMAGAGIKKLRDDGIDKNDPFFEAYKRTAIDEVFQEFGISTREDDEKFWPSMAAKIGSAMSISREEHFRRKRIREMRKEIDLPEDKDAKNLLLKARKHLDDLKKAIKVKDIADATYLILSRHKFEKKPTSLKRKTYANLIKHYLCIENGISRLDPDLKPVYDPDRQKNIFEAA